MATPLVLAIGQNEDCMIRLQDQYASGLHAVVKRDESGRVTVEDLGSTNGTWIRHNGTTVRVYGPTRIYPGDVLIVGRTEIPWTDKK